MARALALSLLHHAMVLIPALLMVLLVLVALLMLGQLPRELPPPLLSRPFRSPPPPPPPPPPSCLCSPPPLQLPPPPPFLSLPSTSHHGQPHCYYHCRCHRCPSFPLPYRRHRLTASSLPRRLPRIFSPNAIYHLKYSYFQYYQYCQQD